MLVREKVSPEKKIIGAVLRDGQSLRIRPISPQDKGRLKDLFYRLSPRTRYLRFQYAKDHITDEELRFYSEVTPPGRAAYVATLGEGEGERIIAVGRWDMLPDGHSAEVAFTVEDNIQLRGIGTILLEVLASEAIHYGITRFVATVLAENTRMLEVFNESGFRIDRSLLDNVYEFSVDLKDQEEFEKRQAYREHIARSSGVRRLLKPARVAVIGASRDPDSVGGALFRNVLKAGFTGAVFPVNPNADSVAGVLAYGSVLDVPGDIDLAVVVVPAVHVLKVVDECARKGVPGLVVISAGFGEAGPEGKEREAALRDKVLSYGIRVIGPNCLGVLNNSKDVRLNATFSHISAPPGGLSLGSQSGALGIALLDYARSINLGVSQFISFGNSIDVSSNDMLEFWEDDPDTSVIALYIESFGSPRKFGRTARRVTRRKPVIAVKAGRSLAGAKAASSHTGALAAADVAVDALFRQAGVIRVDTIAEMFDSAEVLTSQPLPKGPNVAILTNAGGPGVLAADACIGLGLALPALSEATQRRLREFLPPEASTTNPVDMIATASAASFGMALAILLDDPAVDSILVIYIPPLVTKPEDVASSIIDAMKGREAEKPIVTCFMMPEDELTILRQRPGFPIRPFIFPEDAVRALSSAYEYSRYRQMEEGRIVRYPDVDAEGVRERFLAAVKPGGKGKWLMPEEAVMLLKDYGIPVAETTIARTIEEAVSAAERTGFPAVMKLRSSTIVHKSDVGGVAVGLKTPWEVAGAFSLIRERLGSMGRIDEMEGVVVQPLVTGGTELIAGMSQDPVFGPLIMTGFGGVYVELLKDVAFSIHPLRDVDPDRMLGQLKSLPLLKGWRGRPPADIRAFKEVLLRFSALIEDFPEIDQAEINPLVVFDDGKGCVAVDARIYVKEAP